MKKKTEYILFLLWPLIAGSYCYFAQSTFFSTIIWFFILPCIYLSIRIPGQIKKSLIISLSGTFIGLIFDYSAEVTKTWVFPHTLFSSKILEQTPLEVPIWFFAWTFFIVMFYEYFFEHDAKHERSRKTVRELLAATGALFACFCIWITYMSGSFAIPYTYLFFGLFLSLIPGTVLLWNHRHLREKFFLTCIYFFYLSIVYEIIGLFLGSWMFPPQSQFIGWVTLFGLSFPFEELLFWITLGSIGILTWYEYFDDDLR